jgi:hypothetical protein
LPLKLINSYKWAELNKPAKAILPVIGTFANKEGETYMGIKTIMKYAGYAKKNKIISGINNLVEMGIITKRKQENYRTYLLKLTDLARWKRGRTYFPIDKKEMILSGTWGKLKPAEKSLYIVLGIKASINAPDRAEEDYGNGLIELIEKYCRWAGICRQSFYNAFNSLVYSDFINAEYFEDSICYSIKNPGIIIEYPEITVMPPGSNYSKEKIDLVVNRLMKNMEIK